MLLGPQSAEKIGPADRRGLVLLLLVALATRIVWVSWVHPPQDAVFSDMAHYVARAQSLAVHGLQPGRPELAWQAFGTHYLLAIPIWLTRAVSGWPGAELVRNSGLGLGAAALMWAMWSALIVPVVCDTGRLCGLGTRACRALGLAALVWYPHLSISGYFSSEAPFTCLQHLFVWGLCFLLRDEESRSHRYLLCGFVASLCFCVRPQSALFMVLVLLALVVSAERGPRWRGIAMFLVPILLAFGLSTWRYHVHTGRYLGVADSVHANLTAARCHYATLEAFSSEVELGSSRTSPDHARGRRISIPPLRDAARLAKEHPLALRPAMESESLRFVGELSDPAQQAGFRKQCAQASPWIQRVRRALSNLSLLWWVSRQWPELSDPGLAPGQWVASELSRSCFQLVLWLPSLVGFSWVLLGFLRRRVLGAAVIVALCQLSNWLIALAVFGSTRLRLPYDGYTLILAVLACKWLMRVYTNRSRSVSG